MDDDEGLRQRMVEGIDALPVPPAPGFSRRERPSRAFLGNLSAPLSIAAAALAVLIIGTSLLNVGQPASKPTPTPSALATRLTSFTDSFSSGIDQTRWTVVTHGRGPVVTARNGRAELSIPANATAGAAEPITASLELQKCVATGDYVAVVDYEILDWPAMHGVEIALGELAADAPLITRDQYAGGDSIHGRSPVSDVRWAIGDPTGSLRLTRKDGTVTISYRAGAGPWQDLENAQWTSGGESRFRVGLVSDGAQFAGRMVRVAIDNFQLTASALVCK